jgi:hypothetical protein
VPFKFQKWANSTQNVGFDEFTVALLIHSRASGRGAHAAKVGGRGAQGGAARALSCAPPPPRIQSPSGRSRRLWWWWGRGQRSSRPRSRCRVPSRTRRTPSRPRRGTDHAASRRLSRASLIGSIFLVSVVSVFPAIHCDSLHVRVVYYDYATEEQPYCNTNTSCPRLPDHCLTGSLRYTRLQLRLSSAPLVFSSAWPHIAQ